MRNEKAFVLSKDSDLYKKYFLEKSERQKLHNLALDFFQSLGLSMGGKYAMGERLSIELTDEEYPKYKNHLLKNKENGLYIARKNSKLQKEWEDGVVSRCDMQRIRATRLWSWGLIECGSFALWNDSDTVYGYLSDTHDEPRLPDGAEEIPMSEYYKVIERIQEERGDE